MAVRVGINGFGRIKVLSWYDNQWDFSNRMRDVALLMGRGLR